MSCNVWIGIPIAEQWGSTLCYTMQIHGIFFLVGVYSIMSGLFLIDSETLLDAGAGIGALVIGYPILIWTMDHLWIFLIGTPTLNSKFVQSSIIVTVMISFAYYSTEKLTGQL